MKPNGTASSEVRGEPARPDLAERIIRAIQERLGGEVWSPRLHNTSVAVIRESLAPIREALERGEREAEAEGDPYEAYTILCLAVSSALRLLRGEELSGNRGVESETEP